MRKEIVAMTTPTANDLKQLLANADLDKLAQGKTAERQTIKVTVKSGECTEQTAEKMLEVLVHAGFDVRVVEWR